MRLDRFLANNSPLTRREVKMALRDKRVEVAGATQRQGALQVAETDCVTLDGVRVTPVGLGYWMLYKPIGVVCANSDPTHPTVFDLMTNPDPAWHVAGRLDKDTTGLVLISGDGQWTHRVASPNYHCNKRYRVNTLEPLTEAMLQQLSKGVQLRSELEITRPAQVYKLAECELLLTLQEGRYHQVKRMLAAVGNKVVGLHREQIGAICLDPKLAPGEYRPLTTEEIESV